MIRRISADRASFKTLDFGPGLNILRADKSEGATDRDSRNGAGKTSFVELVHFLLGANAAPRSIFRSSALREWRFRAELEMEGGSGSVVRSGARPTTVEVSGVLEPEGFSHQPALLGRSGVSALPVADWKSMLGLRFFGLDTETENGPDPFTPGFRSLFSYFARRQASGGFLDCMRHSTDQQPWDRQVSLSWLLDLDWTISQRLQELREREKGLRGLKAAARSGELTRLARGAGELRTAVAVAQAKARRMKERLEQFRVVPEYADLEREATSITGELHELANENLSDRALLRDLESSLLDEQEPEALDVQKVYRQGGVVLPELVRVRFEEVDRFHRRVLENRRAHLRAEIESANARIAERETAQGRLDLRRQQIMGILDSGGALEEYTALREELGRAEAEVESLTQWLRDVERLETLRTELKAERARIATALAADIRERKTLLQKAILRFEELSESLYQRAGSLTIDWSENGPEFEVRIPSGQSRGIANMQIFCFDLMLIELQAERGTSPGFLIHDSHLFDGVDERQVARALQLGAERAEAGGFQYIVTMNTDALPREGFDAAFAVENYFTNVRLTDAGEDGGLFGIRFD